jgi:thiol-disulfide isomerase/thioredoxin
MGAVSIGPFVMDGERFAAVLGIFAFWLASWVLTERVDKRFGPWSTSVLLAGLVAARLGNVIEHFGSFVDEPWRIFAVWQGGFSWPWAMPPIFLITLWRLPRLKAAWSLAALAAGLITWNAAALLNGKTTPIDAPAAAFEQLSGADVRLRPQPGEPLIVNLWATWCPPCRREMPMMAEIAHREEGVTFMFANQGETAPEIQRYLADERLELETVLIDSTRQLSRHYEAVGMPTTLFIARDGRLADVHVGEISQEALLEQIKRLKNESSELERKD